MVYLSLLVLIIPISLIAFIVYISFKLPRFDYVEDFKYEDESDYENIHSKKYDLRLRKHKSILGAKYWGKDTSKGYIFFLHGIGAGHLAYMSTIAKLVRDGYFVLTYDMYGMGRSSGRSFKSLLEGAHCFKKIYEQFLIVEPKLKDKEVTIMGHSYGAFTSIVGSYFLEEKIVKKVIAIAPFYDLNFMIEYLPKKLRFIAYLIIERDHCLYPRLSLLNIVKVMKRRNNIPYILVYGDKDDIVPLKEREKVMNKTKNISNVTVYQYSNSYHNPYLTNEGEKVVMEEVRKASTLTGLERKVAIENINWKKACEIDEDRIDLWLK